MASLSVPPAGGGVVSERRKRHRHSEYVGRAKSARIFRAYRDKGRLSLCRGCMSRFTPPNRANALFCCRACYQRHKKAMGGWAALQRTEGRMRRRLAREHVCQVCGVMFRPSCETNTICSDRCRQWDRAITERRRQANGDPLCHHCRTPFVPARKHQRLCSPACEAIVFGERRDRQREWRKLAKKRREHAIRAIRRGAVAERFAPTEVFERDGWRCQLCGRRTKPTADINHPLYPTLDHIIPIAKGGPHTRRNTQCACRQCNIRKSDRTGHQLRLIG